MATLYITCRTMAYTPGCGHEHVRSVAYLSTEDNGTRLHSATREEMVTRLQSGQDTAFTHPDGAPGAQVRVARCSGGVLCLTTYPDDTKVNNLDKLKLCSS